MNCMSKEEASQLFMQSSALLPSPNPTLKVLLFEWEDLPKLCLSQGHQSLPCPADVLLGITAGVTAEMFLIATGTVMFNCCAYGLIVTPVAFRLTGGTRRTLLWLNYIWDLRRWYKSKQTALVYYATRNQFFPRRIKLYRVCYQGKGDQGMSFHICNSV